MGGPVKIYSLDVSEGWGIDWVDPEDVEFVIANLPKDLTDGDVDMRPLVENVNQTIERLQDLSNKFKKHNEERKNIYKRRE